VESDKIEKEDSLSTLDSGKLVAIVEVADLDESFAGRALRLSVLVVAEVVVEPGRRLMKVVAGSAVREEKEKEKKRAAASILSCWMRRESGRRTE
jgi:hypothetical protein